MCVFSPISQEPSASVFICLFRNSANRYSRFLRRVIQSLASLNIHERGAAASLSRSSPLSWSQTAALWSLMCAHACMNPSDIVK